MAKPPLNGHLLLWGSWVGNALLTLLAAYVAFSQPEPLTPLTILTIAVCILSGNLLPLGAHALLFQWSKLAVTDEHAEGTRSLKAAIALLTETEARLGDAREACAKATIVARQVPERIREQAEALSASLDQIDSKAMATLSHTLSRFNESLADVSTRLEEALPEANTQAKDNAEREQSLLTALSSIREDIGSLAHSVEALRGIPIATLPPDPVPDRPLDDRAAPEPANDGFMETGEGDPDWSIGEVGRVDFSDDDDEGDEEIDEGEDNLIAVEDELQQAPNPEPAEAQPMPLPPELAAAEMPTDVPAQADAPEPEAPQDLQTEPPAPATKPERLRKAAKASAPGEDELFSEDDLKATAKPTDPSAAVLEVHAMIGINNKVFLRGDPPHLDWDQGIPLELTGIGEYRWQAMDLEGPLACKLLLNDERWAIGENIILEPGEHLSVHPKF